MKQWLRVAFACALVPTGILPSAVAALPPGVVLPTGSAAGSSGSLVRLARVPAQSASDTAGASVYGRVTGVFRGRSGVLPHALLAVETPAGRRWVQAGEDGRYSLDGLGHGVVTIRVRHPGYEAIAVEVTLAADAAVRVDLALTGRPLRLDPVEVRADRLPGGSSTEDEPGRPRPIPELEIQALDLTPGVGDPALAAAVRALPGNDPASATDVLYLRGSTADMKLVLLDGAPVYTPFHVAGLMPGFEPALLGAAALHRGGAPARYDGGLTHILDLRTRSPRRDRLRASAAIDLLTASGAVEGPLGARGGFLASARGLHDVGTGPLGGDRPYGYSDLLLAAEYEPRDDHRMGITAFRNSEAVLLDYEAAPDDATWSNRALSLSYEGATGSARVRALAAVSDYDASLPLQPASTDSVPVPARCLRPPPTGAPVCSPKWNGADPPRARSSGCPTIPSRRSTARALQPLAWAAAPTPPTPPPASMSTPSDCSRRRSRCARACAPTSSRMATWPLRPVPVSPGPSTRARS